MTITQLHFSRNKFELVAYRGGAGERPENTICAFQNAADTFSDVILDLDLQFTFDKRVVVFHDDTLDRTTNGSGRVRDHSLRELQEFDAGFHFKIGDGSFPFRGNSEAKIVELDDVLSSFPNQRILLDIRFHDYAFIYRILETVKRFNASSRCVIMSESSQSIRLSRKLQPDMNFAASAFEVRALFFGSKIGLSGLIRSKSSHFMIPETHNGMKILTDEFYEQLRCRNKTVFVWTVDQIEDAVRLQKIGIDGIFTNFPNRLNVPADRF